MSELFTVQVLEPSPRGAARLWVDSVHPDSGPPAARAVFALMLIFDPIMNSQYAAFTSYTHLEDSPLAQAMDRDDYLDAGWLKANARAFVKAVKLSRSVLEVEPTHPAWIEHLRPGMAWDTAAYDGGPGLPAPPRAPTPAGPSTPVDDPAAGFRVGRPKCEDYDVDGVFIAIHGPNRYVADPLLTDPAAMEQATQALLGQPLLLVPRRGPKQVGTLIERRPDGGTSYYETKFGYGSERFDFADLKSLGRAWLTRDPPAPASEPTKPAARRAAKAATSPSPKPTRSASKTAVKKPQKTASKAAVKEPAKTASKTFAEASPKTTSKATARPSPTTTSKATAKPSPKSASKAAKPSPKSASKAAKPAPKSASKAAKPSPKSASKAAKPSPKSASKAPRR